MAGAEQKAIPAFVVEAMVDHVQRRAAATELKSYAKTWLLRKPSKFEERLDWHLSQDPSEVLVASKDLIEKEVVPYIREEVIKDPSRFQKFAELYLEPRGIGWRQESTDTQEVKLF